MPKCLSVSNSLSDVNPHNPGGANQVVLVQVYYEWVLRLGDMANGSALIQATSVFRSEPYDTN